jgi:ABC-type multidrug transport system fused ATPase/permease subunit
MTACVLLPGEYLMAVWANEGVRIAAADLMVMIGLAYTTWNLPAFSWVKDRFFETAVDMRLISREWAVLQDTAMGLHRVFEILDIEPDVKDHADSKPMAPFTGSIQFEDVAFSYADDRQILDGVNFTAKPGTITAIVGSTGSGKSTMMMLMLRLFDPDRGRVLIDGVDVKDIQIESLRDNISIALQENILFAMSVKDNIRYVRPQTPDKAVDEAARVACADTFIKEMPNGYDSVLGDRGGKLSTGQRQRLSIARALIKDSPILILDEPTAALDAVTEHQVMRNLHDWGKDRAIFIITHRLSTIRQADQILYLHEGKICEAGGHDELMARPDSKYRQMVRTESGQSDQAEMAQ